MFVIVGYLLHDILDIEGVITEQPGGSATYCSIAAKKLGADVGVVSKIGKDYKYYDLLKNTDLSVKLQEKTTTFFNIYRNGTRKQKVANIGEKIFAEDFNENFLEAEAVHIGPVINEIDIELIKHVKQNSSALVTLDPQGFLRKEKNGDVLPKKLDFEVLKYIDIFRCSVEDLEGAGINPKDITKRCDFVIITKGARGSVLFFDGKKISVPAFRAVEKDPTGAGDAYIAGFVKKFLENNDPEESALYASAVASFCVEGIGITGLKGEKDVAERLNKGEKNAL